MAVITPQTDVYLLKVPLEIDDINQLTFANATAQFNYFNSLPKLAVDDFTYQRKDGTIRFGANFDDIIGYNYVMYRNDAYSSKWFYAFITGMEYMNDNATAISIKTDVWQTWCFDLTFKRVFVEREHVNDDTVGKHTVPENLELGEYIKNDTIKTPQFGGTSTIWYAIGLTTIVGTLSPMPKRNINGIPNGLYFIFADSVDVIDVIAQMYDDAGKPDAIYCMFAFPKLLLYEKQGDTGSYKYDDATWDYQGSQVSILIQDIYVPTGNNLVGTINEDYTITKPTKIGKTYTPRNNKLKTYPFCYLNISNGVGNTVTYHWEDFDGNPKFNVEGVINDGCSIKAYPTNYKGFTSTLDDMVYDYGITGAKYPTVSWSCDPYTNWLTQNAINQPLEIASTLATSTIGIGASVASGNTIGAISSLASGISGIGSAISKRYEASLMPQQIKGDVNIADLNYSKNKNNFTVYSLSIKPEYASIIDNWFDMYGYKVNTVKVPNITGRRNWNFVKTVGCYIEGDIPQSDMQEIKSMFDKGVTFWHNPSTFMDYSQTNDIVS